MVSIAHWQLRRLATRALQVLERQKGKAAFLATYTDSLGVTAAAYIQAYDTARAIGPGQTVQRTESEEVVRQLLVRIRGWSVQVARDVPGFDRAAYGDKPRVADDVINDARNMLLVVERHEATAGPLPFGQTMREDLESLIELAHTEWVESDTARGNLSEAQTAVRETGAAFWADLIAFRQSLAAAIGRNHPDYQKLRSARTRMVDADDDEVGAALPDNAPSPEASNDDASVANEEIAS